jgi:hypothetical protein
MSEWSKRSYRIIQACASGVKRPKYIPRGSDLAWTDPDARVRSAKSRRMSGCIQTMNGEAAFLVGEAVCARRANRRVACPAPFAKIFRCSFYPNHFYIFCHPALTKGRIAIVTDVGAGCGGRRRRVDEGADLRTAKSCGPDTPTLVSSLWRRLRKRRWQTSPVTGY